MNIYDTAHRLAGEIRASEECVRLRELRERAYADDTNRVLLEEYKRLQLKLQMSMAGAAGQMPGEDMQRFQQLIELVPCVFLGCLLLLRAHFHSLNGRINEYLRNFK